MGEPTTAAGRALLNLVAPITTTTLGPANDDEWAKRTPRQLLILAIEVEAAQEARRASFAKAKAAVMEVCIAHGISPREFLAAIDAAEAQS